MQRALTDDVIEAAVRALPPEYFVLRGDEIAEKLRARRDGLVDVAVEYHHHLAELVDVWGTAADELFLVEPQDDGDVVVSFWRAEEAREQARFRRRFSRELTDEIRIYLAGGSDRVRVEGPGRVRITTRVVGRDAEETVFEGPRPEGLAYYRDADGDNQLGGLTPEEAALAASPLMNSNDDLKAPDSIYRDWGNTTQPVFLSEYQFDLGLAAAAGLDTQYYGFGRVPWASRHRLQAGFAIGSNQPLVEYAGEFRRIGGGPYLQVDALISGIEQLTYFGLGNETGRQGPDDFFDVSQQQYAAGGFVAWGESSNPVARIGIIARYVDSSRTKQETLLARESPYGFEGFGEVGIEGRALYDSRPRCRIVQQRFRHQGRRQLGFRPCGTSPTPTAGCRATSPGYLNLAAPAVLRISAGGQKVWGPYPYFSAAYLGAREVFVAYNWNRFAGDAMAYAGLELSWSLSWIGLGLPGDLGLVLGVDAGRVYLAEEASSKVLTQALAGVFYSAFGDALAVEVKGGWSQENTVVVFLAHLDWLFTR